MNRKFKSETEIETFLAFYTTKILLLVRIFIFFKCWERNEYFYFV